MENKQILSHGIFWASELGYLKEVFSKHLPGKNFFDLGSGDGAVVEFACKFTSAAYGCEIDPKLYQDSKTKRRIYNENFFGHNFRNVDIIYYYLKGSSHELELIQKLNEEFKGILIIYYKSMKEKQVDTFASFLDAIKIQDYPFVKVYGFRPISLAKL